MLLNPLLMSKCVTQSQESVPLTNTPVSGTDLQELINPNTNTTESDTDHGPIMDRCRQFYHTCKETFCLDAHRWQCVVGGRILHAVEMKESLKCLCVKPTGGGKSLIFNVVATILKGVTICICPLLSLGADQTKKTVSLVNTPSPSPVTAFHLDEMKLKTIHKLKAKLRDARSKGTAVIIYTSPQALNGFKGDAILPFLFRRNLICLVVIDEIHLVTSFGHTFNSFLK